MTPLSTTYDEPHTFEWSMFLEGKSTNQIKVGVLDPSLWISFAFDPGSELNCDTCVLMLGQDGKHNVGESINTFPYDENIFLRV